MTTATPEKVALTVGRTVHYTLTEKDVEDVLDRRANEVDLMGNEPWSGQPYAAFVVNVMRDGSANLRVLLDGTDDLWVTSIPEGKTPGTWAWPPRA